MPPPFTSLSVYPPVMFAGGRAKGMIPQASARFHKTTSANISNMLINENIWIVITNKTKEKSISKFVVSFMTLHF